MDLMHVTTNCTCVHYSMVTREGVQNTDCITAHMTKDGTPLFANVEKVGIF